jgi:predicted SnoaL-like aldol condensation-catalyzing enzyme
MMDIASWVETYRQAWEESDAEKAAGIFTEDATYRSNIFEEPHVGHDGITAYWTGVTSTQSEIAVRMGRPIVDGNRVSVEFWTTMKNDGADVTLPGCLLLEFAADGRCRRLHEYYEFSPGRLSPPGEWG